jgi:hypothetical protein
MDVVLPSQGKISMNKKWGEKLGELAIRALKMSKKITAKLIHLSRL